MSQLPYVKIRVIDHDQQRYPTVGDWRFETTLDGEQLIISVSKMGDWKYEFLVALHELVEVFICRYQGVTEQQVDEFDIAFEKNRAPDNFDEPGDDPKAPYRFAHCIATGVERVVAAVIGVCWVDYEDKINSL